MTDQDDLSTTERLQLLLEANPNPEITMVTAPRALLLQAVYGLLALEDTLDQRWRADARAIAAWRLAHPGASNVAPDDTDLVTWLINTVEAQSAVIAALRAAKG